MVLLSGPPGTGKTLTAEAIAESTRRPLYRPGMRGSHEYELSVTLLQASDWAKEYGAILLLDEADVFLRRRSLEDCRRNEMVAEMLRALDYYVGIIFLTTNLLEDLDHAFLSRIHMHFRYPVLQIDSRLRIWKDTIDPKSDSSPANYTKDDSGQQVHPQVEMSEEDLNILASWELNGREIKNVVKVGKLWCQYNKYTLTRSRLETAIVTTAPSAQRGHLEFNSGELSRKRAREE